AAKQGWEACVSCGILWSELGKLHHQHQQRSVTFADVVAGKGSAGTPRSILKAGPQPAPGGVTHAASVLLPQFAKAKESNNQAKQQALLAICPELEEMWKTPPIKLAEEQLANAAQRLRQLQTQQGRIKAKVDQLVGETTVGAATAAQQEKQEGSNDDTDFPELGKQDLESLGPDGKREYEEASKAAAAAAATLKQAAAAGQNAEDAEERLRKLHTAVSNKWKKSTDGTVRPAGEQPAAAPAEKPSASAGNTEFTDPEAVNKHIEATTQFKVKVKVLMPIGPVGNHGTGASKPKSAVASVDRTLHVPFANVTHFGEKVRNYVQHTSLDVVGIAERHLLAGAAKNEAMKLQRQGSAFQKSSKDISVMMWRLQGATVAPICVYLDSGNRFENKNANKMFQLTRAMAVLWVELGDWNNTPEQLAKTKWLKAMGGELRIPTDCVLTCTSGKGRLINYPVLSIRAARLPMKIEALTRKIRIQKGPRRAQRDRERHANLHQDDDGIGLDPNANSEFDIHRHLLDTEYEKEVKAAATDDMWCQALHHHHNEPVESATKEVQAAWNYRRDPESAKVLGQHFGQWTRAAELSLGLLQGTDQKSAQQPGRVPHFEREKAAHQRGSEPFENAAKRKDANCWEAMAARVREWAVLHRCHSINNTMHTVISAIGRLDKQLANLRTKLDSRYDPRDFHKDGQVLRRIGTHLGFPPEQQQLTSTATNRSTTAPSTTEYDGILRLVTRTLSYQCHPTTDV
ncbi:unnamed protein product, partial [Prorocentrum cordatum]